ncbi:histone-binding protein MSI1 homolog [Pistacia vera]|uniref:histone-binding protein MSI1 homolog n=1 Tax=Pistacia vera TaxID=55513 RepID=UPI0012633337|nr:histone-binding protein MSI1 homolog [Pistacia vera]
MTISNCSLVAWKIRATRQRLLSAETFTYNEPNYLMLAQVLNPENEAENDQISPCISLDPGGNNSANKRSGEVIRARHMSQNSTCGRICLIMEQGHLLSGSKDSEICVWDINVPSNNKKLCTMVGDVQNKIKDDPHDGHKSSVSELSWNPNKDWVIASAAADSMIQIWQIAVSIYRSEYNTLHSQPTPAQCSFNFFSKFILPLKSHHSHFLVLAILLHQYSFSTI